jgi:hypothetical protein
MRSLVLIPFMFLAAPALAQDAPLAKVYACAGIPGAQERLACFDAAVAGLKKDEAGGEVAVLSREQIRDAEEKAFGVVGGVSISGLASTGKAAPEKAPDRITLAIKSIQPGADGKLRFYMENGQLWRQTDEERLRVGDGPWTAEIRKAALGTFLMNVNGQRAIRVKRAD